MEDIRAVMDAAGMEEAALFGESEGGPSAVLFTATYPERVNALVLYGTLAKGEPSDEEMQTYYGVSAEEATRVGEGILGVVDDWGKGRTVDFLVPSMADNRTFRAGMATFERASVSPGMARGLLESYRQIDVSEVLPVISVPTLVLHRKDEVIPIGAGRFIADRIPGARFVELEGIDHAYFTQDSNAILDETERFLTGTTHAA